MREEAVKKWRMEGRENEIFLVKLYIWCLWLF